MNPQVSGLREQRLRALGVVPWHLRARDASVGEAPVDAPVEVAAAVPVTADVETPARILRLALHPDPAELVDPAINKLFASLTEAVGKVGLQSVRVCDVAGDPSAAVMVFGAAPLPEGVPPIRVLRADPLRALHADRERKRLLWARMQALGRDGS